MTDEPKPVTDSRMPGFNPEVEASHAETQAKEQAAAMAAAPAAVTAPPPPTYTHRCDTCGALYEYELKDCIACGGTASVTALPTAPG